MFFSPSLLDRDSTLTKATTSLSQNPDDVVITLAVRTPLAKAKKGGLKDTPLDGMVFKLLEQVIQKSRIDPQMVEDICLGNVRRPGLMRERRNWADVAKGLRRQSSLLRPRRHPRRRVPQHHLIDHSEPPFTHRPIRQPHEPPSAASRPGMWHLALRFDKGVRGNDMGSLGEIR